MKTMENAKIHYLAFFIFLGFIMEIIQSLFRLVPAKLWELEMIYSKNTIQS